MEAASINSGTASLAMLTALEPSESWGSLLETGQLGSRLPNSSLHGGITVGTCYEGQVHFQVSRVLVNQMSISCPVEL